MACTYLEVLEDNVDGCFDWRHIFAQQKVVLA